MAATTGDMEVVITVGAAVTDALLELARADEIALVAMSTHGRGGIQRLLLGSVTDKVVRAAAHPPSEPRGQGRAAEDPVHGIFLGGTHG